jgi:hypothetical protein
MSIDIIGKSDVEAGKSREIKLPPVAPQMDLVTAEERKLYAANGSTGTLRFHGRRVFAAWAPTRTAMWYGFVTGMAAILPGSTCIR